MYKLIKPKSTMPKTSFRDYAFTFLSLTVPGLAKRFAKYDEIDRDTRRKHLETEIQSKDTLTRMDAMIAAHEKKQASNETCKP